jgi:hypothetical protein
VCSGVTLRPGASCRFPVEGDVGVEFPLSSDSDRPRFAGLLGEVLVRGELDCSAPFRRMVGRLTRALGGKGTASGEGEPGAVRRKMFVVDACRVGERGEAMCGVVEMEGECDFTCTRGALEGDRDRDRLICCMA